MVRFAAFLVLGLFVVCGAPAVAASPWQNLADPVFVRADARELPEPAVMSLAQEHMGFLWVGTQGGLARFDGYHFRSFLPNPSDPKALPDGYVRTILPDARGGLWIGWSSNGLVHFDPVTETFRTWRPDAAGRSGPRSGSFAPAALVDRGVQPVVWSLLADRAGTLWAGTQDGLYYQPAGANRFRAYPLRTAAARAARIARPVIYSLYDDRTHELSEANAKLQDLSLSDPLTGLRNRRFLAQHLEADIARTLRRYEDWRADPTGDPPEDADILFFLLDLDDLKIVNDRFGHHAGESRPDADARTFTRSVPRVGFRRASRPFRSFRRLPAR